MAGVGGFRGVSASQDARFAKYATQQTRPVAHTSPVLSPPNLDLLLTMPTAASRSRRSKP
jgi:hypothetical protein